MSGRVESVDYLAAKQTVRIMLRPDGSQLPPRVRISVDDDKLPAGIAAGALISVKARLAPPPPMALPGTYDFAPGSRGLAASARPWDQ